MSSSLYFISAFLGFGERLFHRLLSSSHGLRQGDLLSPLLFVIVMEMLGRMIATIVSG
jgi:hypothetical protein